MHRCVIEEGEASLAAEDILRQQSQPPQKPKAVRVGFVLKAERKLLDC